MEMLGVVVNYKTYGDLKTFTNSWAEYVETEDRWLAVADVEAHATTVQQIKEYEFDYWKTFGDNIGYARAANFVIRNARECMDSDPAVIAIFNADTRFIDRGCVDSCIDLLMSNDDVAVVGPMQRDSAGKITHAGIVGTNSKPIHRGWMSNYPDQYRDITDAVSVSGSAYFIKTSVWDEMTACPLYIQAAPSALGAFLPTQHYYEETFCSYHVREHGYRVLYNGEAEMIHEWHKASEVNGEVDVKIMPESKKLFEHACNLHRIEHD